MLSGSLLMSFPILAGGNTFVLLEIPDECGGGVVADLPTNCCKTPAQITRQKRYCKIIF
jgi:hypothetical protein